MSASEEPTKVVRSSNDPRKDNLVIRYDKESISKVTGDPNSGTAEFYQLISMFIGIYAFMGKVGGRLLAKRYIGKMGRMGCSVLLLHVCCEHAPGEQVPADLHRYRNNHRVIRLGLRAAASHDAKGG